MRKKQKRCLKMESSLPHDVVERVMERLAVNDLLRFKSVSKQWKSTIESRLFQERQFKHHQDSGDHPHVLMASVRLRDSDTEESLMTLVLGSSSAVKIPAPWTDIEYSVSSSSCDGLVCLYNNHKPGFVANPTTRWFHPLPLCAYQQLMLDKCTKDAYLELEHALFRLAFGKDKFTGTYKPVWLYNSSELGLQNATTCEVFDFSTNSWRYVTTSAPCRILGICAEPVFVDGSLHWFTDCQETKVLSFDLHTEVFQVLAKPPFANSNLHEIVMCNLDNRLCVSEMKPDNQVIWSFRSANKTWEKLWSMTLEWPQMWYSIPTTCALVPLALLDTSPLPFLDAETKKKKTLLFYDRRDRRELVFGELGGKVYHDAFSAKRLGYPVCYSPSLISL